MARIRETRIRSKMSRIHNTGTLYLVPVRSAWSVFPVFFTHVLVAWSLLSNCFGLEAEFRIFDAGGHMIRSEHMKSCLAAQKRFLLFKSAEM
jgi:hypothetical protein